MEILSIDRIQLNAAAPEKHYAIRLAGDLLVNSGCVKPAYVDGMLAREKTMSTYLDNGVAIPHGQFDNRELILKTGISVVQLQQGVQWEPGEMAYLIVGIAATGDEHIDVLTALCEVVEDKEATARLIQTKDPLLIMKMLSGCKA
jgi:phosphocarrier protein FPr